MALGEKKINKDGGKDSSAEGREGGERTAIDGNLCAVSAIFTSLYRGQRQTAKN